MSPDLPDRSEGAPDVPTSPIRPPMIDKCGTDMEAPEHLCRSSGGVILHHRPASDPFPDGGTERVWQVEVPVGGHVLSFDDDRAPRTAAYHRRVNTARKVEALLHSWVEDGDKATVAEAHRFLARVVERG